MSPRISKLFILLLMLSALLLFAFSAEAADLTLMVYMSGGNLETVHGAATADIQEITDALPEDDSLNVILMAAGAEIWQTDIDPESTNIYRISKTGLEAVSTAPLTSMGSAESLTRLLSYAHAEFPASHYALIFWDHGAGPMAGLCFDELYYDEDGQSMDRLTLMELKAALEASPFREEKLSWIGMDACLMASVETAAILAPYSDFLIASEETEPSRGWNYCFLKDAAKDPDGRSAVERIIQTYADTYQGSVEDITLSAIDLHHIPDLVQSFSDIAKEINVTQENYADFASARLNLRSMGGINSSYFDLVDLRSLLLAWQVMGIEGCDRTLELLGSVLPAHYDNTRRCNGLSIYYPFENKAGYSSPWSVVSRRLAFAEGYESFLDKACGYWLGEPLADWTKPLKTEIGSEDRQNVYVLLTPEQREQFASARLRVVTEAFPGQYYLMYQSDNVKLYPNGFLQASYNGEAVYLVDEDNVLVSGSLLFSEKNDLMYILAVLVFPDDTDIFGQRWEVGWLVYRKNEAGEYVYVKTQESLDSELSGKSDYDLSECIDIWMASSLSIPTYDENGNLLPYRYWDDAGSTAYQPLEEVKPYRPVKLAMQDGNRRLAFIEVTDLQGNTYCSDLVSVPVKYRTEILHDLIIEENEQFRLTLIEASAVYGSDPYLCISFRAENKLSDRKIDVRLIPRYYNSDTPVSEKDIYHWNYLSVTPGDANVGEIRYLDDFFKNNSITELHDLTFSLIADFGNGDTLEKAVTLTLDFDPSILTNN